MQDMLDVSMAMRKVARVLWSLHAAFAEVRLPEALRPCKPRAKAGSNAAPPTGTAAPGLPPIAEALQGFAQGFDDEESLILLEQYPVGLLQKLQTSSHAAIEVGVLPLRSTNSHFCGRPGSALRLCSRERAGHPGGVPG